MPLSLRVLSVALKAKTALYSLNPSANGALTLNGMPSLNAPDCGAYVGSSSSDAMHLERQASLNLASINIVGEYTCQVRAAAISVPIHTPALQHRVIRSPACLCRVPGRLYSVAVIRKWSACNIVAGLLL